MPKYTTDYWKKICSELHNNKYNYSLWDNVRSNTKVPIICYKHGIFYQILDNHRSGKGCPNCGNDQRGLTNSKGLEYYIKKAQEKHQNLYDYSLWSKNIRNADKVTIICKKHGPFIQSLDSHINNGTGCPKCAISQRLNTIYNKTGYRFPVIHLTDKQYKLLNNAEYMKEQYNKYNAALPIALELKVNEQTVLNYLHKFNIPIIPSTTQSSYERMIIEFCNQNNIPCEQSNRTLITPKEIDLFFPTANLGLEICGIYWHSEQMGKDRYYHKNKRDLCNNKGIQLLTLFEDEIINKFNIIKQKLLYHHKLLDNVYGRKTSIKIINQQTKKFFFEKYHIQGNGPSSLNIGLEYNNEIVALAGFIQQKNNIYILNRYCTKINVIGGFDKIIKYFTTNFKPQQIITFADKRYSNGNLYEKTGWKKVKEIPPDYTYCVPGQKKRIHKFNYRRKMLPKKLKHFNPKLSERENCDMNGLLRIWDCGKIKYEYM